MIDRLVLLDRRELAGVHGQHGAALDALADTQVVARRQRVDRRRVAVDDHFDRLRPDIEVVLQIGAHPRAMRPARRRHGGVGGNEKSAED